VRSTISTDCTIESDKMNISDYISSFKANVIEGA